MKEIVVNIQLSVEGMKYLSDLGCEEAKEKMILLRTMSHYKSFGFITIDRENLLLIQTIKDLGEKAAPAFVYPKAMMKIICIPDDVEWYIDIHEKWSECIHEKHRIWR